MKRVLGQLVLDAGFYLKDNGKPLKTIKQGSHVITCGDRMRYVKGL